MLARGVLSVPLLRGQRGVQCGVVCDLCDGGGYGCPEDGGGDAAAASGDATLGDSAPADAPRD